MLLVPLVVQQLYFLSRELANLVRIKACVQINVDNAVIRAWSLHLLEVHLDPASEFVASGHARQLGQQVFALFVLFLFLQPLVNALDEPQELGVGLGSAQ